MGKNAITKIIILFLAIILFAGWRIYLYRQYDVPDNFAYKSIAIKDDSSWEIYHNEPFGFEIKYPENYYLAHTSDFNNQSSFGYISLRQNTSSADEAKTVGKRIGLYVYRPRKVSGISVGGYPIQLNRETTLDDIAQQFLVDDNRPAVLRNCYQREINGTEAIICIKRAPGEMPMVTSGIFEVFVLGIFNMEDGERILVQMTNSAGGTPYKCDRSLRYDVLRIFQTLQWN